VQPHLSQALPNLLSYASLDAVDAVHIDSMVHLLNSRYDQCSVSAYIDATNIQVYHHKRLKRNRVIAHVVPVEQSTMGGCYRFKLHLVVNDHGGVLGMKFTPAHADDQASVVSIVSTLTGPLFGDTGYMSQQLSHQWLEQGLALITSIRNNMQPRLLILMDQLVLRKRAMIETINDQIKTISQLEHSRHRSCTPFMVNVIRALIAYSHRDKTPSINVDRHPYQAVTGG
jgi:hypothetical protein